MISGLTCPACKRRLLDCLLVCSGAAKRLGKRGQNEAGSSVRSGAFVVLAVIVHWWIPGPDPSTRHVLIAAGFSFLLGLAINQFILLFVHRLRPYDSGITHLLIAPSVDYSFPSDHATASVAIAATFLLHRMRRCGIVFTIAALLMILSRVYVGTHYLSDVLGGALTGIIAAAIGLVIGGIVFFRHHEKELEQRANRVLLRP